jgi:hypothetical protein
MTVQNDVDRQSRFLRVVLALLGAFLLVVGWIRWAASLSAVR